MPIPLFDTKTPIADLRDEIAVRLRDVVDDGRFILGPNVGAFEGEFATWTGSRHAVGVANGTDALVIALRAMGVGPGDEVVVPSFTFYASAEAIPHTGARPVFCDVDPDTFCVTAETVKAVLTPKTKAVIAVHLFGNVAPVEEIEALGVPVLEDAAQAAGSTVGGRKTGTLGTAAAFSFFPSKNLGCFGDGGAVTTDDDEIAERVKMFRFHGSYDRETWEEIGYNSRLDEVQAAILRVLLPEMDGWCAGRRAAAGHYADAGLGEHVTLPTPAAGSDPAWGLYVIKSAHAERLSAVLSERQIGNKRYYQRPLHRQPALLEYAEGASLPVTEEIAETHLAIPMSPVLSRGHADELVDAVASAVALSGR